VPWAVLEGIIHIYIYTYIYIYTRKCEQAPSWMHHFAAEPAEDIEQPANKSEPEAKTIAEVKGLRFIARSNRFLLNVGNCDKLYVFQLKDWVTEEAIARAASGIRKEIIRSWVHYSTKNVVQLKEVLKGRKASTSGKRDELIRRLVTLSAPVDPTSGKRDELVRRLVTLSAPVDPTPPTSHNIETSRELLVEPPQPAAFTADEKQDLISEADETDESTSAKYKLPAGVLTCFRDYVSSKEHTGMRFKAYLLGKVELDEKMQIETIFIPQQTGFNDVQEEGNSRYLWPEDRTMDIYIYICI